MLQISSLFAVAGLVPQGPLAWGERSTEAGPGVYVVAVPDPYAIGFDKTFVEPGTIPNDGQAVIYIGATKHIRTRINQLYSHVYGNRSPHHGGQDVLLVATEKHLFWSPTADYVRAKHILIEHFVSVAGRLPFANKAWPRSPA